jgi:hypothetical protein
MPEHATVRVFDRDWPGRPLPVVPGDLSQYLPNGFGLAAAPIIRPFDDPIQALSRPSYYGFEKRDPDPVRGAPLTEPTGGTVYFDESIESDDLATLLRVMHVNMHEKDFVVFAGSARKPIEERYLDQARIMSKRALRGLFGADKEAATLDPQPISMVDYVAQFVGEQRLKWNDPDGNPYSIRLDGRFGGDGDFAKEALCFGFMVENQPWAVYRVWSRAWLVTK